MGREAINSYDVLVIGGGVVGCAALWALARYNLRLALIEAESDVGQGISRANTAIAHTGFDAPPGSLEARLVTTAHRRFAALCAELDVALRPTGALMLALDTEELAQLDAYAGRANQNGIAVERMGAAEVRQHLSYVNQGVLGGLRIPGEAAVDSFRLTLAYAEVAVGAGATLLLDERVESIGVHDDGLVVTTNRRTVQARFAINAAGLAADSIARMVGDESFAISPRKGQLLVVAPADAPPIDTILLPTPTPRTKGVLIAPAAHGNLLLGPTAEDTGDRDDWATSAEGLEAVQAGARRLVPALQVREPIAQYAGVRSVGSAGDYIIRPALGCPRLVHAAGIRSTGLSASPAIGEHIAGLLRSQGLELRRRTRALPGHRPAARVAGADHETIAGLVERDPTYGEIACLCEMVTSGEVRAAIHSTVPARTLDALKRRLWVTTGACQGAQCMAGLVALLARELNVDVGEIRKNAAGSEVLAT
jgi:glycerol-3-phosphate dehydrogenase